MRIHHLNCGSLCPRGGRLLGGAGGPLLHCLLIEGDDGLILGRHGPRRRRRQRAPASRVHVQRDGEAAARGRRNGAAASRGPGLPAQRRAPHRATHLDLDHAGGISDFPGAAVHVFVAELRAASNPSSLSERSRYRAAQIAAVKKWAPVKEEGESWFGFSAVRAIPGTRDEVLLIPLPGHTRGHCGIAVRRSDDWLLHCGDAYFHRAEVAPDGGAPPMGLRLFESMASVNNAQRTRQSGALARTCAPRRGRSDADLLARSRRACGDEEPSAGGSARAPAIQRCAKTSARGDSREAMKASPVFRRRAHLRCAAFPLRQSRGGRRAAGKAVSAETPDAGVDGEQRSRQRLARERGGIEARPRRGHEQPVELVAAKRAAGDLRAGQFNNSIDAPLRRIAHDASAAPLRVPQAPVAVDGRSVRGARSPKRRKHPLAGQCAAVDVIIICANDLCRRVREIHAPTVG